MNNVNYHTNFSPIDVTFEKTISAFTNGFHVRHIATYNPITCSPDDKVSEVFKKYPDFDQFPVQSNGMTIGVLERNGEGNESLVRDCMRRLDESILVAADEPLIHFLPLMTRPPYYRLILEGTKIAALVTRSDVLKLPVRLLGFTLITNLELLMKEIIASRMPDSESWLNLLSSNRRKKVECKRKAFVQKRVDPPLVELTDFCDKRVILKKYFHLPKRFEDDLKKIEDYRNSLAHAGTFVTNDDDLGEFIEAMSNARYWMSCLNNYSSKQDNKLLETSGTHRQVKELPTESGNKLIEREKAMFEIGKIYHRRTDLHSKYGGNPQSGIAPCANYPIVFLFTSPRGEEHGYKDGWISDTVFQYTGEGQYGDMELTRGNLAIQRHKEQGRELHLFQRYGPGLYTYVGEFEYLKHEIRSGDDTDQKRRKMIVFYLKKCN